VTDSTSWQPPTPPEQTPAAAPSPFGPPPPAPVYGPPTGNYPTPAAAGPGVAPPAYGPPAPQAPQGWTPPPKPGLIPLRPLTVGAILGASFQVLRRNPKPTFGLALLITGGISLLSLAVGGFVVFFAFARTSSATDGDADTIAAGSVALTILTVIITAALAVIGSAILQGIISLEVARGTVGERLTLRGLWRSAKGRLGALIGWASLLTGTVILAVVILSLIVGAVFAAGGAAGIGVGVLLVVFASLGGAVLTAWLVTKLAFVPSALMLERLPLRAAVARSWSLTRGFFWRTFGILLLVWVILYAVSNIVTLPISAILGFALPLIDPNGSSLEDASGFVVVIAIVYGLTFIVTLVFGAISAVVQSATAALLYIDTRMRKEGLDLELTRFVEARQAGDTSVDNPYLLNAQRAAPAADSAPWS